MLKQLTATLVIALSLAGAVGLAVAREPLPTPFAERELFVDDRFDLIPGLVSDAPPRASHSRSSSPGTVVDSTYYDLQDMGGLGKRIVVTPEGDVHVTYQNGFCYLAPNGCPPDPNDPIPFPKRGMGYMARIGGTWTWLGKALDPDLPRCCAAPSELGGFGSMGLTPDGRALIAQHMNEDGCDLRGDVYIDSAVASADWEAYLGEITADSYLFPQAVANPDGSITMLGEIPRPGAHDGVIEFRAAYLTEEGLEIDCDTTYWQFGDWTSIIDHGIFLGGEPGFPSIAGGSDGRVGIAVVDFGGNVYIVESPDGTFEPGTTTQTKITNYSTASITDPDSTSTEYRPFVQCDIAYNGTEPHIVWSEMQARKSGDDFFLIDYHTKIRHWSPGTGIEAVYQVPSGVADLYDDPYLAQPGYYPGFNTASVDWPQVGFSDDGQHTYVIWVGFNDDDVDTSVHAGLPGLILGVGFGDIYFTTRETAGWRDPVNVTNSSDRDDRYPSLAANNPGDEANIIYQTSVLAAAGGSIIGDRDEEPLDKHQIMFHSFPVFPTSVDETEDGDVGAPVALAVHPNPTPGDVHLALTLGSPATVSLSIYDVAGRKLTQLTNTVLPAGTHTFHWNGTNSEGQAIASGIYFARATVDGVPGTLQRIVLVR